MVITIVCDVLGAENNGTTITAKRLIDNLRARGHRVKVVSPMKVEGDPDYFTTDLRHFGPFDSYIRVKNGVELAKPDKEMLYNAIQGSDVVHILLPFKMGIAAEKVAAELGVPTTSACHCQAENITAHVKMQNFEPLNNYIYHRFYRRFYKRQRFIHCPTQFIANELKRNGYGMDLRVISNGVAPQYHKNDAVKPEALKDKFCILTVGRLANEKRHDLLIDAIKLSKYEKDIQLIIAGMGPLQKQTEKRAEGLTNPPMIGYHDKSELVDIMNYSDLYVHPADIEIEAIACLEALTCGMVPIISDSKKSATNHFALHECNLFKAGDPADLAKKIDYMIEHPAEKAALQAEYEEYSKQFRIAYCIDMMEKMFRDAIEDYKNNPPVKNQEE